jgi:O-antigen ligase
MIRFDPHKPRFLLAVKALIVLAPLPFGCVTGIFQPLFYLALLVTTLLGLPASRPDEPAWKILDGPWARRLFWGACGWMVLQLLPLPLFLVRLLSPHSVETIGRLRGTMASFLPLSQIPVATLEFGLRALVIVLFLRVFLAVPLDKKEKTSLQTLLILSGAGQAVFGLIKLFSGTHNFYLFFHPSNLPDKELARLTGTLGNFDHFAFFLNLLIPLALAQLLTATHYAEDPRRFRDHLIQAVNSDNRVLVQTAAVVTMAVAVILTGSRGGILGLILALVLFFQAMVYLTRSRRSKQRLKYIFVAILLVAIAVGMQNTFQRILKTSDDLGAGRFEFWRDSVTMVKALPFAGAGLGTYRYTFLPFFTGTHSLWITNAHNEYLELLAEAGIPGTLLILGLLAVPLVRLVRVWNSRHHPLARTMGAGVMAALLAVLAHSFFDFALRIPAVMFYSVLVLGLGLKWVTHHHQEARTTSVQDGSHV